MIWIWILMVSACVDHFGAFIASFFNESDLLIPIGAITPAFLPGMGSQEMNAETGRAPSSCLNCDFNMIGMIDRIKKNGRCSDRAGKHRLYNGRECMFVSVLIIQKQMTPASQGRGLPALSVQRPL
jgi:hypothetical protein